MSELHLALRRTPVRTAIALLVFATLLSACGNRSDRPAPVAATAGMTAFRYELRQSSKGVLGTPPPGAEDPTIVIEVSGEIAGPRREHLTTKMSLGSSYVALERIEFDDRAWSRDVAGSWSADRPGGPGGLAGIRVDPAVVLGSEANTRLRSALEGLSATPERIGETDTLRYTVAPQKMRMILGVTADNPVTSLGRIEADSTLWVTKDGVLPVRLVADMNPPAGGETHLELTIWDHNADGIKVEPPG